MYHNLKVGKSDLQQPGLKRTNLLMTSMLVGLSIMMIPDIASAEDLSDTNAIIVNANRYDSDIKDVPSSLDVVTRAEIEQKGITRLSDALRLIPNVFVYDDGASGNSSIIMRGIGNEIPFTDPAVSVFVNGVPYAGRMSDFDLQNVERIEVMRGAQSTLYGQNTLAGAVNIITDAPAAKDFSGRAGLKFGSHGHREAAVSVNGAIIENKLGVSLDVKKSVSDGYFKNTTTDNDKVGATDNTKLRAVIGATPVDNLDVELSFDYDHEKGAKIDSVERHKYEFARAADPTSERDMKQGALSLTWYGDGWEASSVTGLRQAKWDMFDNMVIATGNATENQVETKNTALFQEFRLARPKNNDPLGWQVGVYLSQEQFDIEQNYKIPTLFNLEQNFDHTQKSQRAEAYGQVEYEFFPGLTATAGGRLSHVKRNVDHSYTVSPAFLGTNYDASDKKKAYNNAVGKLALSYNIMDLATVYGSFSQGFKPGTARSGATNEESLFLPSERSNTFELGVKGRVDRFTFGLTGFHTNYKNRHTFYNDGAAVPSTLAVPEAVSKGVELNVGVSLLEGWDVFGKAGYLYTAFDEYTLPGTTTDIGGNSFRDAPRWTLVAGTNYATHLGNDWHLFANTDISFQTATQGNVSGRELSVNPAYPLVNAGIGVEKSGFELSLNVKNLFDRYHYNTTAMNDGSGAPGAPLSIFVNAGYKF